MATKVTNGLDLQGTRIVNLGDPSVNTDAANKSYVDAKVAGAVWKESVRAASTANVDIAELNNSDLFGGVTVLTGDRVLLKNQTDPIENGIYIVGATAGTAARAADATDTAEMNSATVFVREGTNADTAWVQTADDPDVGTDPMTWVQFGAGGGVTYTASEQGITLSGTEFQLELDGGTLQTSGTGLRIGSAAAGAGLTQASGVLAVGEGNGINVAADAISVETGAGLEISGTAVAVNPGIGITVGGGDVAIDTGMVVRKFSTSAFGNDVLTSITITHGLGTRDVTVEVYENANPWVTVLCDVARSNANLNDIILSFAAPPSNGQYRVVVHG